MPMHQRCRATRWRARACGYRRVPAQRVVRAEASAFALRECNSRPQSGGLSSSLCVLVMAGRFGSITAQVSVSLIFAGALAVVHTVRAVRRAVGLRSVHRPAGKQHVLLTGTFYNEGWIRSHLVPLAAATSIERIYLVVDEPWFDVDKVEYICPPGWMRRIVGRSVSRIVTVFLTALRKRPDLLMGYHIMPNSVVCLVAASLIGARCAYQMTGGPIQIIGGGAGSENVLLRRLGRESPTLEKLVFAAVRQFDLVVVRGQEARDFVRRRRLGRDSLIITGGIDTEFYRPGGQPAEFDLVCVSRLTDNKGIEHLLAVVAEIRDSKPDIRVAIVGDGPLRSTLLQQAVQLGIARNVEFQGRRNDVAQALRCVRVFVLTSPSEGMSIAMLEAMATGLPAAVTNVGDLGDAVEEGKTGVFLGGDDPARDARVICDLLDDEETLGRMSRMARRRIVERHSVDAIARRWDRYLTGVSAPVMRQAGDRRKPSQERAGRNRSDGSGIHVGSTARMCLKLHALGRWFAIHRMGPLACATQMANRLVTGVDIDLDARVSPEAVIPHTIGVVIGATSIVDDGVVLMPHVVLGATQSNAAGRRHPHIEAGAVIGAGAVLLGPITIGRGAKVGANAVVVKDVPPGGTVVGVPAKPLDEHAPRLAGEDVKEETVAASEPGELEMSEPASSASSRLN